MERTVGRPPVDLPVSIPVAVEHYLATRGIPTGMGFRATAVGQGVRIGTVEVHQEYLGCAVPIG